MKQDPIRIAQAVGGTLAVLALLVGMLASQVSPEVTLTDRHLGIYALLISSLLAVHIPIERKDKIIAILNAVLTAWADTDNGGDNQ